MTATVKFLEFHPNGIPAGDAFLFQVGDSKVRVERWSTENTSSEDAYLDDSGVVLREPDLNELAGMEPDAYPSALDLISAVCDHVDATYATLYEERIRPILQDVIVNVEQQARRYVEQQS